MKTLRIVVAIATFLGAAHALAHGRLADVSIYDRTEGRAYVAGKPGHEYQIRLTNRLGEELLAVMSVDGVNVITGQTAHPSQSGYVLAPRGVLETNGWRRSLLQRAAFYFTSVPDSYAARTGHGRHEHSPAVHVAFGRATTEPAEVITLYYDSHASLMARGVFRTPIHGAPAPGPRPFPGFVPDPWG